jgi:hypothetical protein
VRTSNVMTYLRLTGAAALLVTLTACSGGGTAYYGGGGAVPASAEQPLTVEDIAGEFGCKPQIQIEVVDLRQGVCKAKIGQFFVTTFASESGKDEWMNEAPEYQPHLVGPRWAVLADLKVLKKVQKKVGGDLHLSDHRVSPTPTP